MNKKFWGKLSIIFRMLLVFGFLTISCSTFSFAETLPELNQSTNTNRSYTFTSGESATLEENMGITSSGTFTITGQDKSSNNILFNSFSGFVVNKIQTTLKISDVTITGAKSTVGSVIYNTASDASITLSNMNIESNSTLSQNDALGGAIYANSELTITNTSFRNNSAVTRGSGSEAKGGAIYTRKSIELIADSENVEIVDNYTEDSNGNRTDNAIYVNNSSATLKLNAKNNGKIEMHDSVSGANGYNVEITGDGTGTVGLYNSINNAGNISMSNVNISTANCEIENHQLDNLEVSNDVNFIIDVNLANSSADSISSNNGNGTINVSGISVIDAPSTNSTKVQVLKNADNLDLNISRLQEKQITSVQATMYNSTVLAESIELGTTDTTNDSIVITGWQDTLNAMMNDTNPTHMIKNFIFDTNTEYVLSQNLDEMVQESILTIYNNSSANYGVINANGHSVFKLNNPISTVTMRDIEIKNANTDTNGSVVSLTNNTASFTTYNSKINNNTASGNGGAIYVDAGTVSLNDTEVTGNKSNGNGGALYATGEAKVELTNVDFKDNSTDGKGGAIYTEKDITITAKDGSSTFEGNTANGESNAIYVSNNATLTLNAQDNGTINMNDKISGDDGYNVNITGTSNGIVNLNNNIENTTVTLSNVTLNLSNDNLLSGNNFNARGGTLNLINDSIGNTDFNNFSTNGTTKVQVDVDLYNKSMDRITANSYNGMNGTVNVSKMRLLSDSQKTKTKIYFADSGLREHVKTPKKRVTYSRVYRYIVSYNPGDGSFTFNRGTGWDSMDFNPAVLAAPIAQQVAYMNQLQTFDAAMYHSDSYMMLPRCIREETGNIYNENLDVMTYKEIQEERKSIWVRQFSSFEHVKLDRGPRISLINFGTLAGGESDMIDLGNGYKYVYGGYVGYLGNSIDFSRVSAFQQGAVAGAIGYLYKGNFFNTFVANIGWMFNDSETDYGSDTMSILMTGFSDRFGYNFELKNGKIIIQPSLTLGYSFVHSSNYISSDDVKIKTDPLNTMHVIPGLKIIGNLANGWQPYFTVRLITNFIDKSHFYADGIQGPLMSIDPYVEYGFGVQKRWDDKYSGFAQATARGGSRRGAALLFGFRYMLGRISNIAKHLPHVDAKPQNAVFRNKKDPNITIETLKKKKPKHKYKKEKSEPKFKINILDMFKKKPESVIYNYNTDVSAKVVTDVYPDGVIMPSINGMKEHNSGMDYQDQDRINNKKQTQTKQNITKTKPIEQKVQSAQPKAEVKPAEQKVQPAKPKAEIKPAEQKVQPAKPKAEVKPAEQKVQPAKPKAKVKPAEQKVQPAKPKAEVKPAEQKVQPARTKAEVKPVEQKVQPAQPKTEVKPVEQKVQPAQPKTEVKQNKPSVNKTEAIQRRTKQVNKTIYLNQTEYKNVKGNTYQDYNVEVVEFSF